MHELDEARFAGVPPPRCKGAKMLSRGQTGISMNRKVVLIFGIVACGLSLAGLLSATIGVAGAVARQDPNGIGGASPWPGALLSVAVLLAGLAALVQVDPAVPPAEQPSSSIDAPSLILIAFVLCSCLLASVWAAFSGADLAANLP